MADRTSSSITIDADRARVMAVIADLPSYPEWAGQVKSAEVLTTAADGRPETVRFVLDAGVISDAYTLAYTWNGDESVTWRVAEPGTMVAKLDGSYTLAETGRGVEVTYELAVGLAVPMIGMIKRKAEKVIVDTALKGLKKRVEGRGGEPAGPALHREGRRRQDHRRGGHRHSRRQARAQDAARLHRHRPLPGRRARRRARRDRPRPPPAPGRHPAHARTPLGRAARVRPRRPRRAGPGRDHLRGDHRPARRRGGHRPAGAARARPRGPLGRPRRRLRAHRRDAPPARPA